MQTESERGLAGAVEALDRDQTATRRHPRTV
jgi:hypothetical protein